MLILTTSGHFTVISGRWGDCLLSIKVADDCPKFRQSWGNNGLALLVPTPLHTVHFWTGVFHFRSTVHFKDRPLSPLLTVDFGSEWHFGKYTSKISFKRPITWIRVSQVIILHLNDFLIWVRVRSSVIYQLSKIKYRAQLSFWS